MHWNKHSALEGTHAFLSPSQYSWTNYDDSKLIERFRNHEALERGTELHEYAALAIKHKRKQPRSHETICEYINDGIGYRMDPEVTLYYSRWCYGTADTISFRKEPKVCKDKKVLRIHDLKTGETPAKLRQLEVYAALFCLEYAFRPADLYIILRIYQFDDILEEVATAEKIVPIMDKIKRFTKLIEKEIEGE